MEKLVLQRIPATSEEATLGFLTLYDKAGNNIGSWHTLEPAYTANHPCIPRGEYIVMCIPTPTWSRFYGKREYKYQLQVCNTGRRKGILIHIGNYPKDTKGCILVGCRATEISVLKSTTAYRQIISQFVAHNLINKQITLLIQ